jgi:UDPglucose 6-dehydrogenase
MRGVIAVNDEQRERIVRKIAAAAGVAVAGDRPLAGVVVGVLGLTFKAGTDDLRDSPSVAIVGRLRELGAAVRAHDPTVSPPLTAVQQLHLGDLDVRPTIVEAVTDADVVAVLTEWPEFVALDLHAVGAAMRGDAIVDGRNLLTPSDVREAGLRYDGVGRR